MENECFGTQETEYVFYCSNTIDTDALCGRSFPVGLWADH